MFSEMEFWRDPQRHSEKERVFLVPVCRLGLRVNLCFSDGM